MRSLGGLMSMLGRRNELFYLGTEVSRIYGRKFVEIMYQIYGGNRDQKFHRQSEQKRSVFGTLDHMVYTVLFLQQHP